jgi:methionyl-tRNA synthetase
MVERYFEGVLPGPTKLRKTDGRLQDKASALADTVKAHIYGMELNRAIEAVLAFVRQINKYVEDTAPWNIHKKGDTDRLGTVLYTACEAFRIANVLISPVIPEKAEEASGAFCEGIKKHIDHTNTDISILQWGRLAPGTTLSFSDSLFPRIEKKKESTMEKASDRARDTECMVDIEQFQKLDIRVGRILAVEHIKKSKKLYKLNVDIGDEKRQIVAGIAEHYTDEDLIGKQIAVVVNLKPAKIMGVESNGMILAASNDKKLTVISTDSEIAVGSRIS